MIVDRADRFGLAQLYQLRGRVGRSHRRAFCYLLVPDQVDAQAEERLQVLEHHTDLGSGYRIALRDLELRGAGNLLGGEQSGHVQAVGFDTYLRWLEETVRSLKPGEPGAGTKEQFAPPDVTLDLPAHLPDSYVTDDDAKLDLYRRLARAEQACEIQAVREELRDRFGPLPQDAERLLLVAELRALGGQIGLETVLIKGDEARLTFRRDAAPRSGCAARGAAFPQAPPTWRRVARPRPGPGAHGRSAGPPSLGKKEEGECAVLVWCYYRPCWPAAARCATHLRPERRSWRARTIKP